MRTEKKRKIAFFTPTLHGGGAERMMIDIANEFILRGYDVDLLIVTSDGADLLELINPDINLIDFSCRRMQYVIYKLSSYLKKSNPDAIISTQFHANLALAISSTIVSFRGRVIYRLCIMMTTYWKGNSVLRNLKSWLFLKLFMTISLKRADLIIAQTKAMKDEIIKDYKAEENKIKIIPNFIDQSKIDVLASEHVEHDWFINKNNIPVILSAGRLDLQKDWYTLLFAFKKLQAKIKVRLIIIGDGPDKEKLREFIVKNNLDSYISLAGFQINPFSWIKRADLFVLSTFGEGFPNVVIQSLACNCAVVSTDVPSAPREILQDGKWGKLSKLKDHNDLYRNMLEALKEKKSFSLKERAKKYDKDKVIFKWFDVFE